MKNILHAIFSALLILSTVALSYAQSSKSEEGPVSIIYVDLFKDGSIGYSPVNINTLEKIPPLPTEHIIFNNLAYRVNSEAVWTGANVIFYLPSVNKQSDFDNLRILHLEFDELSATRSSWVDRTILPDAWPDQSRYIAKTRTEFEKLLPNFAAKTIAAHVDRYLGVFVITKRDPAYKISDKPFTKIEVSGVTSPEPVMVGNNVTYTIVVRNKGPHPAGDVWVQNLFDPDMNFLSATSTQGSCIHSDQSDDRTNCGLGPLPIGATATIKIVARVRGNELIDRAEKRRGMILVLFKERPTDMTTYLVSADTFTTFLPRR